MKALQIQKNFEKSLELNLKESLLNSNSTEDNEIIEVVLNSLIKTSVRWKCLLLHGMYNEYYFITVEEMYKILNSGFNKIYNQMLNVNEKRDITNELSDLNSTVLQVGYNSKIDKMISMVKETILKRVDNKRNEGYNNDHLIVMASLEMNSISDDLITNKKDLKLDEFEIDYITTYSYKSILRNELKSTI